jgi:hypothetical protein
MKTDCFNGHQTLWLFPRAALSVDTGLVSEINKTVISSFPH